MHSITFYPPTEQADVLKTVMARPGLDLDITHLADIEKQQSIRRLPDEYLVAVPKIRSISSYHSAADHPGEEWPQYNFALHWMIRRMKHILLLQGGSRLEDNLADASLSMTHGPKFVRMHSATAKAYNALAAEQPGDFLVLRVRTGGEGQEGLSPDEAREYMAFHGRFPLDPIAILAMLYSDRRMLSDNVRWYDALGVEISPKGDGRFDDSAYFDCRHGDINLDWNWTKRKRSFRIAISAAMP